MLVDLNKILHPVLCALVTSNHQFHLTGSRFFGNARENSDWDFFTYNTPEVQGMLQALDFQYVSESYADDPEVVTVLRYEQGDVWFDVQLLDDIERKCQAQAYLKEKFPNGLPGLKSDAKQLWNMAYEVNRLYTRLSKIAETI